MGQYDIRRFAKDEIKTAEAARWDAFSRERDAMREENRYQEEKLTEQTRYDTEQENLMFEKKHAYAENEYNQAMQEYKLAYEQIGQHNPAMLEKLQTQFGKEYKIPRRDGTFETRYVVPKSVREFTSGKVKSEVQLDDILNRWDTLSPSEKTAAWPEIKKINRYFTRDLSDYEASAKRAMSHEDNAKLLDTMGNFLPSTYDEGNWTKAKDILLEDKEVSDAELKLIASNITSHIASIDDAKKFWTDWNTNIMENMSKTGPEDVTVIENLQRMQEIVLPELDKYYSGASGRTSIDNGGALSKEEYNKKANEVSQRLHGVNADELEPSQIQGVSEEIDREISQPKQAGFISDKTIRGQFEQPSQDEESTVDFEKGTIEYPRENPIARIFDQMKTTTPKELGYASMESFIEGEFEKQKKENPDFVSTYFNNDRDVWRKWFTGKRTGASLPVPVPQKGKAVIQKGGVIYEIEGEKTHWNKNASNRTIDPLNGKMIDGKILKGKINKNKVQFANSGIIAKEEWPFWDRVGKAKARQSLRK